MANRAGSVGMVSTETAGSMICRARESAGMTQAQLAARLGVTQQAVSKLESARKVTWETAYELEIVLGIAAPALMRAGR